MKKNLTILLMLIVSAGVVSAQSKDQMLAELSGNWELTSEGKVAIREIFQFPGKTQEELFHSVQEYFRITFAESPVREADPEKGQISARRRIEGARTPGTTWGRMTDMNVIYDMVVEFKDDRIRMSAVLWNYEAVSYPVVDGKSTSNAVITRTYELDPATYYPVNPDARKKNRYHVSILYNTYKMFQEETYKIKEFINTGMPASNSEISDW